MELSLVAAQSGRWDAEIIRFADEKPSVRLRKPDGSYDKPKRWHPGCIPRLQRGPAQRAFEAADLPGRRHRFSTAV